MYPTDTIVFLEANSTDLLRLKEAVDRAVEGHQYLRVTMDGKNFKYKVGEGSWTPPIRSHRPNGGY